MNSKIYIPSKALQLYVHSFRVIDAKQNLENRVLPNSSFAIVFTIRGQISYINNEKFTNLPSTIISGVRKSVRNIGYQKGSKSIIVMFTEVGISSFFKEPLFELFERSVSLDNFVDKNGIIEIEEKLNSEISDLERIKIIEQFLFSQLYKTEIDLLIEKSISEIYSSNGNLKIKELSQKLFISQDAFEKRFRKIVGSTPKQFSSIIRLKSITKIQKPNSLIDLALENGFYDQSHFNREFKTFTGLTPTEFYNSGIFW